MRIGEVQAHGVGTDRGARPPAVVTRGSFVALVAACFFGLPLAAHGQQQSVVGTVHNLSSSGPGDIKSLSESQVCKFCHVPHNAIAPVPLWGHALPAGQQRYGVPTVRSTKGAFQAVPQPDGSSRLCLSCHDGTVALGEVAGKRIAVAGADRLQVGRKGFLGTDLSGGHPISFEVKDAAEFILDGSVDIGLRPLATIRADRFVKLDERGMMQCTSCHDPHSDKNFKPGGRVPHFWVKSSVEEVCLTCHDLR